MLTFWWSLDVVDVVVAFAFAIALFIAIAGQFERSRGARERPATTRAQGGRAPRPAEAAGGVM